METPREITNDFPEQEKPLGALAVANVLEAFRYSMPQPEVYEDLSTYIHGVQDIVQRGFSSTLIHDYTSFQKLDFGRDGSTSFWEDNKQRIAHFADRMYEAYVEEVAGQVTFFTGFFEEHPRLVRIGAPDGPYIEGLDAEFVSGDPTAQVVVYREGEGYLHAPERTTKAYVELSALPVQYHAAMARYRRDHEV